MSTSISSKIINKANAFDLYPLLKKEFIISKNGILDFVSIGSNKKYWFNCSKCNKIYFNSVKNWIRKFKNNSGICKHIEFY